MGQQACFCKAYDCANWLHEGPGSVEPVHAIKDEESSLYKAFPVEPQIVQEWKRQEFENAILEHQDTDGHNDGEVGCQAGFVPPPAIPVRQFIFDNDLANSEPTSPVLSQGSIWDESCKSETESLTPRATLSKSERAKQKKTHLKAVVKEFRSEAQSGIPCKVYRKESDAIVLKNCTMTWKEENIKFKSSEPSSSEMDILELPLFTISVLDYQQVMKKSCDLDNIVERLQHEDPNALPLSVFLHSAGKIHCIVLQDQNMMSKCKLALQVLSNFLRDKALKDTMA